MDVSTSVEIVSTAVRVLRVVGMVWVDMVVVSVTVGVITTISVLSDVRVVTDGIDVVAVVKGLPSKVSSYFNACLTA